ncbi:MAG: DNA-3-methyladenine glycosylase [Planctomycetia bacterium]|nr:DNA-3-methyladenine glycosylase [Planctomycetia bacterium]
MRPAAPLPLSFYARTPEVVARELLGKRLFRRTPSGLLCGTIVEAEAYLADGDPACHASRGKSRKNATMFGPAGRAYVYVIHARHCLNVVTEREGAPSAVLIRAVEPLRGVAQMQRNRQTDVLRDLARGPARLCEAMVINRLLDGWDLTLGRSLWIAEGDNVAPLPTIAVSHRIGVTSAHDLKLRYYLAGNTFVSGTQKLNGKPS